jgi:Tol biopolymer transport system component
MRNGDLDIYIMDLNGGNVRQITNVTGYDGGAFFSYDSKRLVFRASRPKPGEELDKYKQLLTYNLVEPISMELFVINVDGTNMRQITNLTSANWAPYYYSDNKRIIFSSDFAATAGFGAFDLYMINDDGTNLERITWDNGQFDSFPMFSYDGKKLVWGSSRNGSEYDLNLFIADWVDDNALASSSSSLPTTVTTTAAPIPTSSVSTQIPAATSSVSVSVSVPVTSNGTTATTQVPAVTSSVSVSVSVSAPTSNGTTPTTQATTTSTSSAPPTLVNLSVFLILIVKVLF